MRRNKILHRALIVWLVLIHLALAFTIFAYFNDKNVLNDQQAENIATYYALKQCVSQSPNTFDCAKLYADNEDIHQPGIFSINDIYYRLYTFTTGNGPHQFNTKGIYLDSKGNILTVDDLAK